MIDVALDVVGAVIGYFYAGELASILGIKAVGVLAGFGAGSVIALFLSIARGSKRHRSGHAVEPSSGSPLLNLAQEERDACRLLSSAVGGRRPSLPAKSSNLKMISRNRAMDKNIANRRPSHS